MLAQQYEGGSVGVWRCPSCAKELATIYQVQAKTAIVIADTVCYMAVRTCTCGATAHFHGGRARNGNGV